MDRLKKSKHGIRGYYWRVVIEAIAIHMAEPRWREAHRYMLRIMADDEEVVSVHDWLKYEFLPAGDTPQQWEDEENYYSTKFSELPQDKLADYVNRVVIWARTEGIEVPPPTTEQEPW